MIAEREIAGFVLPFVIGIIASIALSGPFFTASAVPATISILLVLASVFFLIHPSRHRYNRLTITALILVSSLGCGLTTGFTCNLTSLSSVCGEKLIPEFITDLGEKMKSGIESIPFKNIATNKVIAALITGERTGIPHDLISSFRESGASHILALSGLHLGIIYGMISRLLLPVGHSTSANKIRAIMIIISCGIYTAATGAGASITRAFLFILVGETARLSGRQASTAQVLMVALFLQSLLSPDSIKDVGFQLSYAAMAGIAFIFPHLKNMWPGNGNGPMRWIWTSASMSIACQITTGPVAYFYFGTFPQHFLLTNIIALPLTGIMIPSALATLLLHSLGICPKILIVMTEYMVDILTGALSAIASM